MQANGLWGQLAALKKVVTEPKGTGEAFDTVMKDYYTAIRRGQGGLFMAVCRGKVCTAAWDDLLRIRSCRPCRMHTHAPCYCFTSCNHQAVEDIHQSCHEP